MNGRVQSNGNLKLDAPFPISLNLECWTVIDETTLEPRFPKCIHYKVNEVTLKCGKKRYTWWCNYFKGNTSVRFCNNCEVRCEGKVTES
jgi:hypothetical protein